MTLLAIDAGNTRLKWGLHDGAAWTRRGAVATAQAALLETQLRDAGALERAIVANVAGDRVARAIADVLQGKAEPYWVVAQAEQCGVRSGYAEPARLGADRWAALIGAHHLFGGPCVVVNAGTTMTVDALAADGVFLGGFIVPGYEMMRSALAANTAQLALREGAFSFFPDNTGDAIASGALNALVGAVERMCRFLSESADHEPTVALSGGNAELLVPLLKEPAQVVDNLVLEGLARIGASGV